jgi:vancomycin resistance protein VanW
LDYRFKNTTDQTFQLIAYVTDTHLCGELRSTEPLKVKYHIASENEHFVRKEGTVYRRGQVYRSCIDKRTGNLLSKELIRDNNARVMYDSSHLEIIEE